MTFLNYFNIFQVYVQENMPFEDVIKEVGESIAQEKRKRARLKDLDLIVLDNSIRESTVGQLRGHAGKQVEDLQRG